MMKTTEDLNLQKLSDLAAPKSDQLNATDLVSGPMDLTITKISVTSGDQPLSLHADSIPGRPWKPCKTMMRWMSEAWKTDEPSDIVGKTIRVYNDKDVMFGPMKTGGIRISHLSHIDAEIYLQEGNRRKHSSLKMTKVKPLPKSEPVKRETPKQEVKMATTTDICPPKPVASLSDEATARAQSDPANLGSWWNSEPTKQRRSELYKSEPDQAAQLKRIVEEAIAEN